MVNIKRILIATDFSACSNEAFDYAAHLATRLGVDLYLLYVFEPPMYPPAGRDLQVPPAVHQDSGD